MPVPNNLPINPENTLPYIGDLNTEKRMQVREVVLSR